MSGSPILQNGKLVGAVTHVMINDPAQGYGIFAENMPTRAGSGVNRDEIDFDPGYHPGTARTDRPAGLGRLRQQL